MRLIRFLDSVNQLHYGVQQEPDAPSALRIQGDPFANYTVTHQLVAIKKLLAPVAPPAVMCIGTNYRKHAEETGAKIPEFPVLFMKNPAAVQNPGDPILIPTHLASEQVDWECELAIVIGKRAKNVSRERALEHVLGYTCANDVSARDWQRQWGGSQWCRGKTFDTFCPLGPAIITTDDIPNPNALRIQTKRNGQLVQDSSTADMIFDVPALVAFLSGSTTLLPGTVILTGTPSGVGMAMTPPQFLKPGDTVTISIEKIGDLTNPVQREPS
ncbi:MAG TPA: fumarylacetoacetate hydrolase family protein [Phycisphaerae bacterium]|nr:fumarylacetoacetate hydrolase family protein [Phycisphaerae bacterium]